MRREYRYLRDDILQREVRQMRQRHMPVDNIARTLGRTRHYTQGVIAATERAIDENRKRAAFKDGDPLGLDDY